MTRNSLGSSRLAGHQLGMGHPIEVKIKIGKDSWEGLKVSINMIDAT
jgi:hypothetical protein